VDVSEADTPVLSLRPASVLAWDAGDSLGEVGRLNRRPAAVLHLADERGDALVVR
jgi:hypothetical protein